MERGIKVYPIKELAKNFIGQVSETRKPHGQFYSDSKSGGVYVAVDNTTGDAWTEEFSSKNACKKWLKGYTVKDAHGYLLND